MHRRPIPVAARTLLVTAALAVTPLLVGIGAMPAPATAASRTARPHHKTLPPPTLVGRLIARQGDSLRLLLPSGKSETVQLAAKARMRPEGKLHIQLTIHDYIAVWQGKQRTVTLLRFATFPIGQARVTVHAVLVTRRGSVLALATTGPHPAHMTAWLTPATRVLAGKSRVQATDLRAKQRLVVRGARYGSDVVVSVVRIVALVRG